MVARAGAESTARLDRMARQVLLYAQALARCGLQFADQKRAFPGRDANRLFRHFEDDPWLRYGAPGIRGLGPPDLPALVAIIGIGARPGRQPADPVGQRRRLLVPAQYSILLLQQRRERGVAVVTGDGGRGGVLRGAGWVPEQSSTDRRQACRAFAWRFHS